MSLVKTVNLFRSISKILAPPPKLTISEWADNYRVLSQESAAEPGRWRTDRAPYQREIFNAISDPRVEKVVIMSSAQVGKTEIINNTIGYYVDYDPAAMLLIMPTVDLAESYSKKKLAPMIRDTPVLSQKIKSSKSRDSDNTILEKGFPGGYIAMVGANSPTGLSSRSIRILLADEIDRFPASAGKEGDPLSLAEQRTKTFWNKKKVFVSTPTEKGISRIEKEFETSTKEEWCLPCPVCGAYQPLKWSQIKFDDVTMECAHCKERCTEYEWKSMATRGIWIAENEDTDGKIRGFHLNALSSPWESWNNIIFEFKKAKKNGKETLKTWVNTTLGEVWEEDDGEKVDYNILLKRREAYSCWVPDKVLVLTAGIDVQDDRIEIEVVGWGKGKESWGIEYKQFFGDLEQPHIWKELDEYLLSSFFYANNSSIKISCACIDTGGHYTSEVYKFVKPREIRKVFGIKGYAGYGKPLVGKYSQNNREKIHLFPLGVDTGKESVYSRLNLDEIGPGYCHFPIEAEKGYNLEYFKSLCSERRVISHERGVTKFKWIKKYKRNEGLDLRNYANAALEILRPNFEILAELKEKGMLSTTQRSKQMVKKRKQISKGI